MRGASKCAGNVAPSPPIDTLADNFQQTFLQIMPWLSQENVLGARNAKTPDHTVVFAGRGSVLLCRIYDVGVWFGDCWGDFGTHLLGQIVTAGPKHKIAPLTNKSGVDVTFTCGGAS